MLLAILSSVSIPPSFDDVSLFILMMRPRCLSAVIIIMAADCFHPDCIV